MANTSKVSLIFKTIKKNDKEDSYKLAKLLLLGELPEVRIPLKYSDDLGSMTRYRKSIVEDIMMIKNRIHTIPASYGITIDNADIFGKSWMKGIKKSSTIMSGYAKFVLYDMIYYPILMKDPLLLRISFLRSYRIMKALQGS